MTALGALLRSVRVDRGISLKAAAAAVGISIQYACQIEKGARSALPQLDAYLGAIGASPEHVAMADRLRPNCRHCGMVQP